MSNVKFNPTEGENDKLVSVFSEINEGLDTTLNYTISDEGNKAKKSIVVNQVGKREKLLSKKGEGSEPFVLSESPEWLLVSAVMRTMAFARLVICMRITPFLVRIAPIAALPNCC